MSAIWSVDKIERLDLGDGRDSLLHVSYSVRKAIGKQPWVSTICVDTSKVTNGSVAFDDVGQAQVVEWIKETLLEFRADFLVDIESCLSNNNEPVVRTFAD